MSGFVALTKINDKLIEDLAEVAKGYVSSNTCTRATSADYNETQLDQNLPKKQFVHLQDRSRGRYDKACSGNAWHLAVFIRLPEYLLCPQEDLYLCLWLFVVIPAIRATRARMLVMLLVLMTLAFLLFLRSLFLEHLTQRMKSEKKNACTWTQSGSVL